MPPHKLVARAMTLRSKSRSGRDKINARRVGRALHRASMVVVAISKSAFNAHKHTSNLVCNRLLGTPADKAPTYGLLLREIRTSRLGVGQSVDVSQDGHILMGFSTRLKYDFSWLGNEYGAKIFDPRIRLWDLTTGKEVGSSSSLFRLLSSGYSHRFRLSPDGSVVLSYANVYRTEQKTKPRYQLHFFEFH